MFFFLIIILHKSKQKSFNLFQIPFSLIYESNANVDDVDIVIVFKVSAKILFIIIHCLFIFVYIVFKINGCINTVV